MLQRFIQLLRDGGQLSLAEAIEIADTTEPAELFRAADELRRHFHQDRLDLCSIANAKSGKCSENCKFCAQSAHYPAPIATYDCIEAGRALLLARESEAHGVGRFSLVTAGRSVTEEQLAAFGEIYSTLGEETQLSFCASMGLIDLAKARILRSFGVRRYHCNLETCRSYFAEVCTSQSWEDKVATITSAQQAGLEVCSGGIIGLGESRRQRLELAVELRELGILSIPINILNPIANTPFADLPPLGLEEVLITIAMFRLINPLAVIRMAGGRGLLAGEQHRCFQAGANGAIVGNYLTTLGQDLRQDLAMFKSLGFATAKRPGCR